jgi:TM2 domain-containing membrane protein YozV
MDVRLEGNSWYGKKNGQEILITGQFGNKYQECVYKGDDFVIFEGKPQFFTGDSTGQKAYTIFSIKNGFAKKIETVPPIQGYIDGFEGVYSNKFAVKQWDGANCYKQYYDFDGNKLDRDPSPIDTLEKKKKREREQKRNTASSDTNSDNEEKIASNIDKIGNNVADVINSGLIPKRSKITAYIWCILLGWFGAHQVYLGLGKVFGKKDFKAKDYIPSWRGLLYVIWVILPIGGLLLFNEDIGFLLLFVGLGIMIIFWIIDLITLGKQVDKVNEKIAKKFGF